LTAPAGTVNQPEESGKKNSWSDETYTDVSSAMIPFIVTVRYCKLFARVMMAYRGSPDLVGPWNRGTDATAHARLIQGNADYLKNSLATRLAIAVPGPGYVHFNADSAAGFDEDPSRTWYKPSTSQFKRSPCRLTPR